MSSSGYPISPPHAVAAPIPFLFHALLLHRPNHLILPLLSVATIRIIPVGRAYRAASPRVRDAAPRVIFSTWCWRDAAVPAGAGRAILVPTTGLDYSVLPVTA